MNPWSILITYFIFAVWKKGVEGIKGIEGEEGILEWWNNWKDVTMER